MKKTKVVQINSSCGHGSTGKIAVAISRLLNEHGVENYIFYSGNHNSDYPQGIMTACKLDIRLHQIQSRFLGDQGFHSSLATLRMVRKIEQIQPDAIVLHNLHGYYLNLDILFRFLKRYQKPVYWTLHDCWAFTGHCTHYMLADCDRWKHGCGACSQKNKYPYTWFLDRSASLYRRKKGLFAALDDLTIITPSQWLADQVAESFLSKCPVQVIHNGIDLKVFSPRKSNFRQRYGLEGKRILLGVASVWSEYKGLDVFLSLFQRLDREKYQLILVGTDSEVERQIPNGVITIPRTQNQAELAELYTAADIFINPTREDNYPTVNMEAIACGTPVITFHTGGCAEIVDDSCGAVVWDNTLETLIKEISNVEQNLSWYRTNCRARASEFEQSNCFNQYVQLICG